jgi:hypothetical protein
MRDADADAEFADFESTFHRTTSCDNGNASMDVVKSAPVSAVSHGPPPPQHELVWPPPRPLFEPTVCEESEMEMEMEDMPVREDAGTGREATSVHEGLKMEAAPVTQAHGASDLLPFPPDAVATALDAPALGSHDLDSGLQQLGGEGPSDTTTTTTTTTAAPQTVDAAPALGQPFAMDYPPLNPRLVSDDPMAHAIMDDAAAQPALQQRLSAFARLRFGDGSYYMHTYQIILGRNVELAHRDMRRLAKAEKLRAIGKIEQAEALLRKTGKKRKRANARPRSVISQVGGIVNAPMSAMPAEYQQRRQSVASQSISSSSHQRGASSQDEPVEHAPQHVIMQAFEEVPDQLDSYVPEDPNDCPLVPIHPQQVTALTGVRGPKGISREHAKIYYNFQSGNFEIEVLSNNGLYHEDTFYNAGKVVELSHGDTIVIGMVDMQFFLPDVALTEAQRLRQESSSRPMSFQFENGHGEIESEDMIDDESASEEVSVDPRHLFHMPVSQYSSEDEEMVDDELDDEDEDEPVAPVQRHKKKHHVKPKLKIRLKAKARSLPSLPPPPRPRKEAKIGHKRKHVPEPSPEEPTVKKSKWKGKEKEPEKIVPKEKTKVHTKPPAAKVPAAKAPTTKAPAPPSPPAAAPEQPPAQTEERPEPTKTSTSESPTLARKPTVEGAASGDELELDGTITAEMIVRHNLPEILLGMTLEKRKGPGRPPKDGVMSKRQRAQLVKQGKEIEKARAAGMDPADIPMSITKPKVSRPRKGSNANPVDGEEIRETTEGGEGGAFGDKKQTKPNKPPRTPSPVMKEEDYTEEQLQRPGSNYVVLIHEAISSSETGQMNLQQIYNYIERNYPWYKFKTSTSGWQSSVRHNLSQHDAFTRGDKEGKGYNWRINPDVSIEKERRKRQASPQLSHAPRHIYYPPPDGYPPYANPGPYPPGMPAQAPSANGPPRPPPNVESVQPRLPPSVARSAAAASPAPQGASNASPYASPWAGGSLGPRPATQNPPRPYPPPNSQHPVSTASAPSGQYGVLFPTSAPPQYSSYPRDYATASTGPYGNGAPQPYPSYPPAGSPPTAPPGVQNHSYAPHPSGRYPSSVPPNLIAQLEAFRTVYLQQSASPIDEETLRVDNAIRAIVHPSQPTNLTDMEDRLRGILIGIPDIARWIESTKRQSVQASASGNGTESPKKNPGTNSETPQVAAAMAATDAAVAASSASAPSTSAPTELSNRPPSSHNSTVYQPTHSAPAPVASASNVNTQPPPPGPAATQPQEPPPHRYTPNMSALPNHIPVASPLGRPTSRPSVEPLTPLLGSPAVHNAVPVDHTNGFNNHDSSASRQGGADADAKRTSAPTTEAPMKGSK